MATRKKTNTEVKSVGEEFATAPKRARALKSTATEASVTGSKPASRKSSAATHKAPARKTVLAAAPETVVETVVVETVTFDVAAHHEEIGKEAYYNWLRRGCPHGSEQEDWLAAIEIVRARYTA